VIPLKDDNPRQVFPFVTWGLIAVNVMIFIWQLFLPEEGARQFVYEYGAVPAMIVQGQHWPSIITSMFLHGGIMHLLGNMLYLFVFGDNIESICGHFRFIIFYLICGCLAFASHFVFEPMSDLPMIGASGAISGVLGAYALRFPRARVYVLIPIFLWIYRIFKIPAIIVLGVWFLLQLFSGVTTSASGGGVAWFAHIGGFIAGIVLIKSFEKSHYKVEIS
jgi:membrane associated rhomboid family serine protease